MPDRATVYALIPPTAWIVWVLSQSPDPTALKTLLEVLTTLGTCAAAMSLCWCRTGQTSAPRRSVVIERCWSLPSSFPVSRSLQNL